MSSLNQYVDEAREPRLICRDHCRHDPMAFSVQETAGTPFRVTYCDRMPVIYPSREATLWHVTSNSHEAVTLTDSQQAGRWGGRDGLHSGNTALCFLGCAPEHDTMGVYCLVDSDHYCKSGQLSICCMLASGSIIFLFIIHAISPRLDILVRPCHAS